MLTSLNPHDEFLLTLMQLRLVLLNKDLADCFDISPILSSFFFTSWMKLFSKLLKNLFAWLPRGAVGGNLPEAFIKTENKKCRVTLDCAWVFIERPKSSDCQAATWSDYKHHNTIKFLENISPSGFITFLRSCYGGQTSNKFITKNNGFYYLLERDDVIMADRHIQEDLLVHFCNLQVTLVSRKKSQMTKKRYKRQKNCSKYTNSRWESN